MNKIVVIHAAIIVANCWASASFAQDTQPSLAETLAWIDGTYNPHGDVGGAAGHGIEEIYSDGRPFKRRISTFTYDGCQMSLFSRDDPASPVYRELYTSRIHTFNLRDIDPNSIKSFLFDPQYGGLSCEFSLGHMVCSIAEVEFTTYNNAPLIEEDIHIVWPRLQGSEHEARDIVTTYVAAFYIDDAQYADRFVKAFRHAIVLCGGKSPPF